MRNDELPFVQKLVGNAHTFVQQSPGILAKIQNQSLQFALLIERIKSFLNLFFCRLVKA